jgi:DNA-directed RNA polymerase specialized sigma24 family protein
VPIDDLSFREFFASQFSALYWMGLLLTSDHGQAEELAQDALVRTYNRWKHVRRPEDPVHYARRVLVNRHRSLLRRAVLEARHRASVGLAFGRGNRAPGRARTSSRVGRGAPAA